MYIYTYINRYSSIKAYVYIGVFLCKFYVNSYMFVLLHIYTCMHIYTKMYIYIHIYVYVNIYPCMDAHAN